VSGQKQVIATEIEEKMTDNLDGTFTLTRIVDRPGNISIIVTKYEPNLMYWEYRCKSLFIQSELLQFELTKTKLNLPLQLKYSNHF